MIKFCSLSSGSKGNTSFIEINGNRFLIDAGNTTSYIENNLREIDVNPRDIKGIFITHAHHDHTDGLKVFLKRYNVPLYLTEDSLSEIKKELKIENYILLDESNFDSFKLTVIPTSHDVKGSCGFIFDDFDSNSLVYITDTGYLNEKNLKKIENKKMYYFESNHDVEMLMNGCYPYYLKQRILSDKGHLSNKMSSYYLHKVVGDATKTIILAHLSEENNNPELAVNELKKTLEKYDQSVENILVGKQNIRGNLLEL